MSNENHVKVSGHVQELVANPSPLGLLGLAIVTLVASSQKMDITSGVAYIIPWAIFLGAAAQFVAGWLDFKHNNTFGATAFCAYGFFWFAVGSTWFMQTTGIIGQGSGFDVHQLGFAFLGYFIFTMFMTVGAMGTNKVLFIIFFLIDLLFLGLFMNTLGWGGEFWHKLAAYSELAISLMSFYGSAATLLNTHYGFTVLPIGTPFGSLYSKAMELKASQS
ncbi:Inner membrane protein YaaH [Sporotomaculum syntrophicum]|uniref:Inner membrane protein YaaH n=1 Tax=Sporotomaculum syntrophicum TaxID=182264 RepID=A0A9D2WR00_9FIRM|nr:GPR1/FUN34/YaaH family transporter [Sporotomaculum syntrophicum]KAF1085321.1 Inner membrane protein YaaH [Sporotomaculum syntrophicum]